MEKNIECPKKNKRIIPENSLCHTFNGLLEWKNNIDLHNYFEKMNIVYNPRYFREKREYPEYNSFLSNGVYHLERSDQNEMFGKEETAYRLVADTDFDIKNPETGDIIHISSGERGGYMTPDSVIETVNGIPAGWVFDNAKLIGTSIHFSDEFKEKTDIYRQMPETVISGQAAVVDSTIASMQGPVFIGEDALVVDSKVENCFIAGQATVYGANTVTYQMHDWGTDLREGSDISGPNICKAIEFYGDTVLYKNDGPFMLEPTRSVCMDDTIILRTQLSDLFIESENYQPKSINLNGASIQNGVWLYGSANTIDYMSTSDFSLAMQTDMAENTRRNLLIQIATRFKPYDYQKEIGAYERMPRRDYNIPPINRYEPEGMPCPLENLDPEKMEPVWIKPKSRVGKPIEVPEPETLTHRNYPEVEFPSRNNNDETFPKTSCPEINPDRNTEERSERREEPDVLPEKSANDDQPQI